MDQELNLFEKIYAAYERAFVLHDDSWLTPSVWVMGGVLVVIALTADQLAGRWHERKLARSQPPLTAPQLANARRWFAAGTWAFYFLVLVSFVLAYNWPQ